MLSIYKTVNLWLEIGDRHGRFRAFGRKYDGLKRNVQLPVNVFFRQFVAFPDPVILIPRAIILLLRPG